MNTFFHHVGLAPLDHRAPWSAARVRAICGGHTFLDGAYRCHTDAVARAAQAACERAFPRHTGRWTSFGGDWMGRQFVCDAARGGLVSIVDPGFSQVLETQASIQAFHDEELLEFAEASVLATLLRDWVRRGNSAPTQEQCAGYRHPPFLGGPDDLTNVEVGDLVTYLEVFALLYEKVRDLPSGQRVRFRFR